MLEPPSLTLSESDSGAVLDLLLAVGGDRCLHWSL